VFLSDQIQLKFCLLTLWVVKFCGLFSSFLLFFDKKGFTQRLDLGSGHFLMSPVLLWLSLKSLSSSWTRSVLFHWFSFDRCLPIVLGVVFWSFCCFLMVSLLVLVWRVVGTCWGSLSGFWSMQATPCFSGLGWWWLVDYDGCWTVGVSVQGTACVMHAPPPVVVAPLLTLVVIVWCFLLFCLCVLSSFYVIHSVSL
jgi:hypothetical protein